MDNINQFAFDTEDFGELGRCIREIRKKEGLSAEEFGKRVGMAQAYLSRLEGGKIKKPSYNSIIKLAQEASKTKVVQHKDLNLDNYNTPFARLVQFFLSEDKVSADYKKELYSDKLEFIANNLTESELDSIVSYFGYKKYILVLGELDKELAKLRHSGGENSLKSTVIKSVTEIVNDHEFKDIAQEELQILLASSNGLKSLEKILYQFINRLTLRLASINLTK